jgi:alkyl hydroperoxide reductase subunit AhpF
MTNNKSFDVIIIGGSYAGLSAGMALGRALRKVLIIDSGKPCNAQTPYSHNFLTQDGKTPQQIAMIAREQLNQYKTIENHTGVAKSGKKTNDGFEIAIGSGEIVNGKKLIFATGVTDIMLGIKGFAQCWGISIIHCPYCHGYDLQLDKRPDFIYKWKICFIKRPSGKIKTKEYRRFGNGNRGVCTQQWTTPACCFKRRNKGSDESSVCTAIV